MAVEDYTPKIGKDLLDSLILKLYSESLSIYREYVQNACDSIYEAFKCGIIDSIDKGSVAININTHLNRIVIRDNGTGISKDNAVSTLMDIYHGSKDGVSSAGQYGIGRLSGGGYCKKLVFATSTVNETTETRVIIDVERLRIILKNNSDDRSAEEIMQEICSFETRFAEIDSHYMEVTLENVCHSTDKLMDEEIVKKYIQAVAPIDYSVAFKSLIRMSDADMIRKIKDIRHIHVSINDHTDIQKEYGYKIEGTGDIIDSLRYFKLEDKSFGRLAWGWFAVTPFTIAIPDSDNMRGIQLRKHNIALDKSYVDKLFSEARGNTYFYGEIFIDNDAIVPNSNRDGLAPSAEADALSDSLREYFKLLKRVYSTANQIKIRFNAISTALDKYETEAIRDEIQREAALDSLKRTNIDFLSKTDNKIPELKDVGNVYLKKYQDDVFKDGKTLESCVNEILNSKAEGKDSFEGTKGAAGTKEPNDSKDEKSQQTKPTKTDNTDKPNIHTNTTPDDKPKVSVIEEPQEEVSNIEDPIAHQPKVNDIYQELEKYGYGQEAIDAIRKAYAFLLMSCPRHLKGEVNEIISKAIILLKNN